MITVTTFEPREPGRDVATAQVRPELPLHMARQRALGSGDVGGPEVLMSVRRKVPDAETARAWLDAARRSGLPRVDWCASAGVDARSLQCWRLALDRRAARSASPFVEWVARPEPAGSSPPAHPPLRVHAGEAIVDVPRGFHVESLAEVIRVLRSC